MNALRRFARKPAGDRCGLCSVVLGSNHPHLVDARGKLLCSCAGCEAVLGEGGKFRRVPRRVVRLADFRMTEEDWQGFAIPVGMAFFLKLSGGGVRAFYPSPLGAVETSVPEGAWETLLRKNPRLGSLEADVEALLVRRSHGDPFLAPIDACYGLVGLMRREWRGLTGGEGVERAVDRFFERLRTP